MAQLVVESGELVVHLAWWERVAARRSEVRVPLAAVRDVTVERDWWRALRGLAGRGTWIPALICVGARRHSVGEDFTVVRPRHPVVCVELNRRSSPFARLAVSAADPEAVRRSVRAAAGLGSR
ncbi:hypothetical protein [Peterkaempfera bronchialis]|uniref:Uncharacterized protein n=1 Tax=Peterkaempfera bronchialis TaxID=2126346 RepID=A0A345SYR7_9ACTN|nr:hypothetical protein [Peterkaempfera bronchialis]AXI78872.1 hypothetical protein C7M71_017075 [Peterkaempfera bronchialis]